MKLPGFEHIAPDFSNPVRLIRACHQRITDNCKLLEKITTHIEQHGYDDEATIAIKKVSHYFSVSAPLHHQDEEQNLFPLVIKHQPNCQQIVSFLAQQHQPLDQLWKDIDTQFEQQSYQLNDSIENFCTMTLHHLQQEELHILSIADAFLTPDDLSVLATAMQTRRQQ